MPTPKPKIAILEAIAKECMDVPDLSDTHGFHSVMGCQIEYALEDAYEKGYKDAIRAIKETIDLI